MIPTSGLLDIEVIPLEFQTVTTRATLEVVSHTHGRFEVTKEGGTYEAVKPRTDSFHFAHSPGMKAYNAEALDKTRRAYKGPSLAKAFENSRKTHENHAFKTLAFEYTPQKKSFDWVRDEKVMKGTPGKVEFFITQYPDVIIDYLGGPIYCPPSSDPDYEKPVIDMLV